MNSIQITIPQDQLTASVTIKTGRDSFPSEQDLTDALNEAHVCFGIDQKIIEKICHEQIPVTGLIVARGITPVQGQAANLQWHIPIDLTSKPFIISDSDRVDFKRIKSFHQVRTDQLLVTKIPGQNGSSGKTVNGKIVELPVEDVPLPAGRNTYISQDGLSLFAAIDGFLMIENGLLHIDNIYHVPGDVNYNTGNIKFDGAVIIDGDVRSGFRVEAKESIYVGGNVEAAMLYSQEGDITVQYGIVGKGKAKILAGGSLICGFVQDSTIGVRCDVIIDHYAINSAISAGGKMVVNKNEGLIRGGSITAEKSIIAIDIGSNRSQFTELKIRNSGENENQNRLWELSKTRTEVQMRISLLNKQLSFLNLLVERQVELSVQKQQEKVFIEAEIERLHQRVNELDRMEIALQQEAAKERLAKEITILGILYPNVNIDISGLGFHNDSKLHKVKILRFKQEIIVESLEDMESSAYDIFVPTGK